MYSTWQRRRIKSADYGDVWRNPRSVNVLHALSVILNNMSDYWGCPKCGHATLRVEDKNGRYDVATCEYDKCDYFDGGVPE